MFDYFWYHNIGSKDVLDYFSLWIAGIEGKLLKSPEQVRPSQVYPVRHVHTCDPMVLAQIHMTRKISCTFVYVWEITGFQSQFLEYDTCINLLILNTECDNYR